MNGPEAAVDFRRKRNHSPAAPDVSVIMATLLEGEWESSVRSAAEQSDVAAEVIVVVDRPDADLARLEELATRTGRIKVLVNQENIGLTRSLNRAASVACGRFLIRQDDDDLSRPGRLSRLASFLDTHPEVDIACSYAAGSMEAGGIVHRWTIRTPLTDGEIKRALESHNCITHPTVAFRAARFGDLGGYDERFRYAQDYDIFLRARKAGFVFACLPEVLVDRAYPANSITVSRRYTQATYSFAAKLLHKADTAERRALVVDTLYYLALIATPSWARRLRRVLRLGR